jgi:hypothetical protein
MVCPVFFASQKRHPLRSNIDTTAWAAYFGHLECLKYAHENGCPDFFASQKRHPLRSNIDTTTRAAEKGHLECLKYIYRCTKYCTPECETIIKPIINNWINLVDIAKNERSYVPSDIWYLIGKYW